MDASMRPRGTEDNGSGEGVRSGPTARTLEIAAHLVAFLPAFLIGILGALTYFRSDDLEWVNLGRTFSHAPWIPFVDVTAQQAGYYRPVVVLYWIAGHWAWGTDPTGYALLLAGVFGVVSLLLYRLGALLHDRASGVAAALVFATFPPTVISLWWRSLATSGLLLLFLTLAVYLFARAFLQGSRRGLVAGLVVASVAFLTKESALLLPLLLLAFLLVYRQRIVWPGWRRWVLPPALGAAAYGALFVGAPLLPANYGFSTLGSSFRDYSVLGQPLEAVMANALTQLTAFLGVYLRFLAPLLLVALGLIAAACVARGTRVLRGLDARALVFGLGWAGLALLPYLVMTFPGSWYLLESSLGASLSLGLLLAHGVRGVAGTLAETFRGLRGRTPLAGWREWVPLGGAAVGIALLLMMGQAAVGVAAERLTFYGDQSHNFREALERTAVLVPEGGRILVATPTFAVDAPHLFALGLSLHGREDVRVERATLATLTAAVRGNATVYVVVPDQEAGQGAMGSEAWEVLTTGFSLVEQVDRLRGTLTIWTIAGG